MTGRRTGNTTLPAPSHTWTYHPPALVRRGAVLGEGLVKKGACPEHACRRRVPQRLAEGGVRTTRATMTIRPVRSVRGIARARERPF